MNWPLGKLHTIIAAIALLAAAGGGYRLGAARWEGKYQAEHSTFATYRADHAEKQLEVYSSAVKEWRAADEKREAAYLLKVAAAHREMGDFQKRLQEAERADPTLADCLRMPVPSGLFDQSNTAAADDRGAEPSSVF